jgi:hypothetical protein
LNVAVQVSRVGGFDGPVTFKLDDAPDGFSADDAVASDRSSVVHIEVASRTEPGTYQLTIAGTGLDVEHQVNLEIVVKRRP